MGEKHSANLEHYRVVLLSGTLRQSGSSTWILALQGVLRQLGCPVIHIVTGDRGKLDIPEQYEMYYTGKARRHGLLRLCRALQLHKLFPAWFADQEDRILSRRIGSILHERGWRDRVDLVVKDFSASAPSLLGEFKGVSVIHQMLSQGWQDPQLRSKVEGDYILAAVSAAVAADAQQLGLNVPHILYNPLEAYAIQQRAGAFSVAGDFIVFAGKLECDKGVYALLEAYSKLSVPEQLIYLGSGRESQGLAARVRELGLESRVQLLGFQANPYPYIAAASLLVLPSSTEAMGYVCLEAAVLDTPFLVSDYPAASEFFIEQVRISLTPGEDFSLRLAEQIRLALSLPPRIGVQPGILDKLEPEAAAQAYLDLI